MKWRLGGDAVRDLERESYYLARQDSDLRYRFQREFVTTCERLADSPTLGHRQETSRRGLAGIRRWRVDGFPNHLIFYREIGEGVEIVRLLHAASDWAGLFGIDDDIR